MKQSNLSYISYCGLWPTAASKKACCTCGLVFLSFACTPVSLCAWLYSRLISGLFWAQVVAHKLKAFANIYENTSFAIQSTYSKGFWWLFTVFICVVLQSKRQGHRLRCDTQRGVVHRVPRSVSFQTGVTDSVFQFEYSLGLMQSCCIALWNKIAFFKLSFF